MVNCKHHPHAPVQKALVEEIDLNESPGRLDEDAREKARLPSFLNLLNSKIFGIDGFRIVALQFSYG